MGAGLLLIAAGLAQMQARLKPAPSPMPWHLLALSARLGSLVALVISLMLAIVTHGEWSPSDLRQVTIGLALATLLIHLLLVWRLGTDSASPIVDAVALVLVLIDAIAVQPGGPLLSCVQRAALYRIQWVLFLLGCGGTLVAGSAGLVLGLCSWSVERGWQLGLPDVADIHSLLRQATALAWLLLGSGIVVSAWWAWQTVGALTDGDVRVGWCAITWLILAMSELAWHLDRPPVDSNREQDRGRWSARLAVLAAAAAIWGLLAVTDLLRLLGM
jgi:hypothetical protein